MQASNNQMVYLSRHGIGLPKPQTQRGVTWTPKRKWAKFPVEAIIAYVEEGNGAGPEIMPEERVARYAQEREKFEGQYVVQADGKDQTRWLILCVVPETQRRLAYLASRKGVEPSQMNPFTIEIVAEDEYPDYEGHIHGAVNLGEYRLTNESQ